MDLISLLLASALVFGASTSTTPTNGTDAGSQVDIGADSTVPPPDENPNAGSHIIEVG